MEKFPLTANGKIDKAALPAPVVNLLESYRAPRNETESRLALIWQGALKVERIGIADNYFNAGGDSIKAIRLINAVNREFDVDLTIASLYLNPTIEELAGVVAHQQQATGRTDAHKEAAARVDQFGKELLATYPDPDNIEAVYPMSEIEKGMVFHSLRSPDRQLYYEQVCLRVKYRNFDADRFARALSLLTDAHEILRTGYNISDFAHVVYKQVPVRVARYDIAALPAAGQQEHIQTYLRNRRSEPVSFIAAPLWWTTLFKTGENHHVLVIELHHAILDGWSFHQLLPELNNTYTALKDNPDFKPARLRCSYRDFIVGELVTKGQVAIGQYWKKELQGYKRLALGAPQPGEGAYQELVFDYGKTYCGRLEKLAADHATTVNHLCFAAYVYALYALSYENDIVAGITTNSRPLVEDGDKLLGCFLNTVPVRVGVPAGSTWLDFIGLIHKKLVALKSYDRLSLIDIVEILGERSPEGNPFFDTKFNYVDFYNVNELVTGEEYNQAVPDFDAGGHLNENTLCDIHIYNTNGVFKVHCKYFTGYISEEGARRLAGYLKGVLDQFIKNPYAPAAKSRLFSAEENALLHAFNATEAPYPQEATMASFLEQQARKTPDAVALVYQDQYLTYGELSRRSDDVARTLAGRGAGPGAIVGMLMDRCPEMVIGIWGIIKSGGAYLPVSPGYPASRIQFMLADSGATLLLTDGDLPGDVHFDGVVVNVARGFAAAGAGGKTPAGPGPRDAAYLIYTSGTTGHPKGVVVEHGALVNRLHWMQNQYRPGPGDVMLFKTPYSFDVSVWEIFWWSMSGASLCILPPHQEKEPQSLLHHIARYRVSVMHFVPSMLRAFMAYLDECEGPETLASLRQVFASGEALGAAEARMFNARVRGKSGTARLINLYGPTEATIDVSSYECAFTPDEAGGIPIGKPIDNIKLLILDKDYQLQPVGVPGEICIAGAGLARGYLNRPELTRDTFRQTSLAAGGRIYCTGDLGRLTAQGDITFLGRADHQVKIRGYRIEPGEIEHCLLQHPSVSEAVLVAYPQAGDNFLCAYVVASGEVDEAALRAYLGERLPDYMIPAYFVPLRVLPKTNHGKLDRQALPLPTGHSGEPYQPARGETERMLLSIWQRVLGRDRIGVNDNFFSLGGHSLKAVALVSGIHKAFEVRLPIAAIFSKPTLREQAIHLRNSRKTGYASIPAADPKPAYALSAAQQRMYVHQQMDPATTSYNVTQFLRIEGEIDLKKVEGIFQQLIARHEVLRTSIGQADGKPYQQIHAAVDCRLALYESAPERMAEVMDRFRRPFDFARAPLV
ncbi:MAG: amino acid adenylation domain-containing protein, partial [Cytophagales bacterium]|nr:amino acid adenylation domain-containing protein [Cytophagales bacterium]